MTKPGVTALVVVTALAGLLLAPSPPHPVLCFAAVLAVAMGSAGAGAVNMWLERRRDGLMLRTAGRPLPAGRVAADSGFVFGMALSLLGFILMTFAAGPLAGILLAGAAIFYAFVYTVILKPRTEQNIVIGGAAGALPPVIGWVAGGGALFHPLPWALFLLVFLWTPPHFWALALPRRGEYAAAGLPMLPSVRGAASAKRWIFAYSLALVPAALAPALWLEGTGRLVYALPAAVLSLGFLGLALALLLGQGEEAEGRWARRLFSFSIWHLFALFALLPAARFL